MSRESAHALRIPECSALLLVGVFIVLKDADIVVNIRNGFGVTPLIEAAQFGRRRAVNVLLKDERM